MRTNQYDLIPIAKEIEDFLNTINANITVAIMGCAVNGPGEAKHADIELLEESMRGLLIKKVKSFVRLNKKIL